MLLNKLFYLVGFPVVTSSSQLNSWQHSAKRPPKDSIAHFFHSSLFMPHNLKQQYLSARPNATQTRAGILTESQEGLQGKRPVS